MRIATQRLGLALTLCAVIGGVGQVKAGIVYDAASEFSTTSNPNGVWRYGNSASLGGAFNLFTTNGNSQGMDYWNFTGVLEVPMVEHNGTANPVTTFGSVTIQPGQLAFHPGGGPNDQFTLVRFTVPTAGDYAIDSKFTGLDFVGPTTTDVHVLIDGVSIFNGSVNAYGSGPSFSSTLALLAGVTVDFAVGRGSNGTYNFDTTGLDARIADLSANAVPEPSTILSACVAGLAGLVWLRRAKVAA